MPFWVGRKGKCDGEGVPESQQRMWVAGNRVRGSGRLSEGSFQKEETGVTQICRGTMAGAEIRAGDEGSGL